MAFGGFRQGSASDEDGQECPLSGVFPVRDYRNPADPTAEPAPSLMPTSSSITKVLSTVLGLGLMVVGTWYILWLIGRIWWGMGHPLEAQQIVEQWAQVLGADEMKLSIPAMNDQQGPQTIGMGKLAAGVALGMGHLAMAYMASMLIAAGSRVVTYASSDREAIKRLIQEAFPNRT